LKSEEVYKLRNKFLMIGLNNMLSEILKTTDYGLSLFSAEEIQALEKSAFIKESGKKQAYYVQCLKRKKDIQLKPEEIVRQLFLRRLMNTYQYPEQLIDVEFPVTFGRETKRADIVIREKDRPTVSYIVIEVKSPKFNDGKKQLKGYCDGTGALMGVWINGNEVEYYHSYRKDPNHANFFDKIPNIPNFHQKLSDIISKPFYLSDLEIIDKERAKDSKRTLKDLIVEMEEETLANAGVDVFEEGFKLIFAKIFDESESGRNDRRVLQFRNTGETDKELYNKINNLFQQAKGKWQDIFLDDEKIDVPASSISICVSYLENRKLLNSNLDLVDEAFEYLFSKTQKEDKGQYFTPRYVIDMCVKMLNPQEHESMIDPAAGSSGFTVHSVFHVWKQILENEGIEQSHLFTASPKNTRCIDYAKNNIFAIEYDKKVVKVARCLNIIAGDGECNVLKLNTLDYSIWKETTSDSDWIDTYNDGWKKFRKFARDKNNWENFDFDIVMANPPFAGDIDKQNILMKYHLGMKHDGKQEKKVGRDILFIERNLNFLKPGGRMAIVLPQGRFNNSSDKRIRDFIAENCRILAVVGLHQNTFKPHTGTKTSVLFVQKWTDDNGICPKKDDYNIFFATQQKSAKDNSGDKIYLKDEKGNLKLDIHWHPVVEHDLFAIELENEEKTPDGIAEAFIEFAKKEKLSFFV